MVRIVLSFWCLILLFVLVPTNVLGQPFRPIPITIAEYGGFPLYTTLYVADAKGYFADQGLRVTILAAGGDEKVFAALLSGNAQFGVGDPTFAAIGGQRGQPGKVIASILQNVPQWGMAKDPKIKRIETPDQLAGYRVATYPAPSTSYTLQKRLFQLGKIAPSIVQITYGGLLSALEAGAVDIALEYEPMASVAEKNGAHRVYSLIEYFPDFALTGLIALPQYLQDYPATAQRVVNALQRASNFLRSDTDEAADVVGRRFPEMDAGALRTAIKSCLAVQTFPENGIVRQAGWDKAIALRREVGDLKGEAAYADYVITEFAERAKSIK